MIFLPRINYYYWTLVSLISKAVSPMNSKVVLRTVILVGNVVSQGGCMRVQEGPKKRAVILKKQTNKQLIVKP